MATTRMQGGLKTLVKFGCAPGFVRRGRATEAVWAKVTRTWDSTSEEAMPVEEARRLFDSDKRYRMYGWGEPGRFSLRCSDRQIELEVK